MINAHVENSNEITDIDRHRADFSAMHARASLGWLIAVSATARTGIALTANDIDRDRFATIDRLVHLVAPDGVDLWTADIALHDDHTDAWVAARYVTPKLHVSVLPVVTQADSAMFLLADREDPTMGFLGDFVDRAELPVTTARRTLDRHGISFDPKTLVIVGILDRLRSPSGQYGAAYDVTFAVAATPSRVAMQNHAVAASGGIPFEIQHIGQSAIAALRGEPYEVSFDEPRPDRTNAFNSAGNLHMHSSRDNEILGSIAQLAVAGKDADETSDYDRDRYVEILKTLRALQQGVRLNTSDHPVAASDLVSAAQAVTPKICVSVAILDEQQRVLLVKRAESGQWDFISGYADPGDPPVGVAHKESLEELDVNIQVDGLIGVVDGMSASSGTDGPISTIALSAHITSGDIQPDPTEIAELGWFEHDQLPHPLSGALYRLRHELFENHKNGGTGAFFDVPEQRPSQKN